MQRLYFNFDRGDVRLLPFENCPPLEYETSFPNVDLPDEVSMEMIRFEMVAGQVQPVITYPSLPVTALGGQP